MKNFQNKAKIVKVSKIIRAILFLVLVGCVVGIAAELMLIPWKALPVNIARYMGFTSIAGTGFNIMVFGYLFWFFNRLKNGCLFDAQTVRYLDLAGKWLVAHWFFGIFLIPIGYQFAYQFAPGSPTVKNFHPDFNFERLLAGLSLVCGAWLLKEAQGMQEEQELTV